MISEINILDFNYNLNNESIAKYPLEERDQSKLLFFDGNNIVDSKFTNLPEHLPAGAKLVFNNTKVIHARMVFFKPTGARIEIFCLEPHYPRDYERAFIQKDTTEWVCMVGNLKKWKEGILETVFEHNNISYRVSAEKVGEEDNNVIVKFCWSGGELTFGQLLELLGTIPIPPYLNRSSEESDNTRYQTVYSLFEGSVAAPTAGLHFTENMLAKLAENGFSTEFLTLHVGAGTFLPVKGNNAAQHTMHIEHFSVTKDALANIISNIDNIIAVGTTSVRTLESLATLGYRVLINNDANLDKEIGQWEAYEIPDKFSGKELLMSLLGFMDDNNLSTLKSSTQIMITKGYCFRVIRGVVTNFHQPQSTLLLLVNAIVGENWKTIYDHALATGYRFLSYGDSSLLLRK